VEPGTAVLVGLEILIMGDGQATLNAVPRTQMPQLADYKPLRGAAIT